MRGSVKRRERANGKPVWVVRVEYDRDPMTAKRRQVQETFRTRKEADRRLAEWLAEIDRGTAVVPSTLTIAGLMESWLRDIAASRVRPTTLEGYRALIGRHIVPELGTVLVQKLTPARVQAFYRAKQDAGATPRTVQLCHLRLSQALRQAVRWSIVPTNVCDAVTPPSVEYKRGETWNAAQLKAFLTEARSDSLHPLWVVLATTGMRRGEALGLRWRDVDLDRGSLTVVQSVVAHKGAPLIQSPKTRAGRRAIGVSPDVVAVLKVHRAAWSEKRLKVPADLWAGGEASDALVFSTQIGTPLNPNNVTRNYDRIVAGLNVKRAAAGLEVVPRIRVHDLRHTHATLLLRGGEPAHVVARRLGHAKVSITLDTYAHVLPDMQDRAVSTFAALLADA